ncbi:hypothetical protein K501DRAFT_267634 [Backusella circina FSU 941]|nr:hypothetical protein K501DRAFT_267634 [Backusella circina FSU 941]
MPRITNAERNLYNKVNNHKKNLHKYDLELRRFLKKTITNDQPAVSQNSNSPKALLRKDFEEYRHFCPGCAIDVCLHCYNNWRQVKDDPKKTEHHNCLKHAPHMFTLSQKYTGESMDTIMMEDVLLGGSDAEAEAVLVNKLKMKSIDFVVLPVTPDSDDQQINYFEDRGCSSSASLQERSSGEVPVYDDDSTRSLSMGGHGASANYEAASHKDEEITTSNKKKSSCLEDVTMTEESIMLPEEYIPPDLGPKMFTSQVNNPAIKSRTKLHCDIANAVNVMCYTKTESAAAVWDIFASKDLPDL